MSAIFEKYRAAVMEHGTAATLSESLRISGEGSLATYYAPFDFVNISARVVLVGITPGQSQASVGLRQLSADLHSGAPDGESLKRAKETASFSGGMRASLVALLDGVGMQNALGLETCGALFGDSAGLVHYTSALRYPVLYNGQNYSGSPQILKTPYLLKMVDTWLAEEAARLPDAIWIPLGREPTAAVGHLVRQGLLDDERVLSGLPHPSGANAERINYFLGRKPRELLSSKTNPETLDTARTAVLRKVARIKCHHPIATSES